MDLLREDDFLKVTEAPRDNTQAQEWLKTAVLLGLGIYFVVLILTNSLTNYINASLTWLSYMAAVLFFLLGGGSAFFLLRQNDKQKNGFTPPDHLRLSWGALLMVAAPLVFGTLIPSRPLDANAISGGVATNIGGTRGALSVGKSELEWNVLDWLRAFNNSLDLTEFNGKAVDVVGFIYREPGFAENEFMLARFTVACCVADASAIGLPVIYDGAPNLETSAWLRVQGTFQVAAFRGADVPVLQAGVVEEVPQPKHPYLYP